MWCIVPAAGIGSRFGSSLPKQYTEILPGVSILEYTLNQLIKFHQFKGIMVALHPNDEYWASLSISKHQKIHTCIGGVERSDSVIYALDKIEENFCTIGQEWVMVHDAARPAINLELLEKLYKEIVSSRYCGGILATRLVDTIKHGHENNEIINTVDRNSLWAAQTPQMFKLDQLTVALKKAKINGYAVTDEASAIERSGGKVLVVEGEPSNFKITTKFDLTVMQTILNCNNLC